MFSAAGLLTLSPLPGGRARMVATVEQAGTGYDPDAVQRLLDARVAAELALRVERVVRSSDYYIATRLAERYRAGRVFLAGDAFDLHRPSRREGKLYGVRGANPDRDARLGSTGPGRHKWFLWVPQPAVPTEGFAPRRSSIYDH